MMRRIVSLIKLTIYTVMIVDIQWKICEVIHIKGSNYYHQNIFSTGKDACLTNNIEKKPRIRVINVILWCHIHSGVTHQRTKT